jgi:hypothetical protein
MEFLDNIQNKIIEARKDEKSNQRDDELLRLAEDGVRTNLAISKEFLKTADGHFKKHLEKVIKQGEDLLAQMEARKFIYLKNF